MIRTCLLACVLALSSVPAHGAASLYSELYGKNCKTLERDPASGASTRQCAGVAGFSLLVHEARAQTSIDIVTPRGRLYPLEYWEVVTPGLARVGRMAEWRVEQRQGKLVPTALLVRLDAGNSVQEGPREAAGSIITAARIAADGACVVYQGDGAPSTADASARSAAAEPARKCLGVFATARQARAPLPPQ
jgi:hypothetical protein